MGKRCYWKRKREKDNDTWGVGQQEGGWQEEGAKIYVAERQRLVQGEGGFR